MINNVVYLEQDYFENIILAVCLFRMLNMLELLTSYYSIEYTFRIMFGSREE